MTVPDGHLSLFLFSPLFLCRTSLGANLTADKLFQWNAYTLSNRQYLFTRLDDVILLALFEIPLDLFLQITQLID